MAKRFRGSVEIMAGIIDLDPELDPHSREYWMARLRSGGPRRVLRLLAYIVLGAFCSIGFVTAIFWIARLYS